MLQRVPSFVDEDWLLVLDLDEFLWLQSYSTVQDYLETIDDSIGQIQFPWLIQMSQFYSHERTFDIVGTAPPRISDHHGRRYLPDSF